MRNVFLFWGIILLILIIGIAAIIYGKVILEEEGKRQERLIEELAPVLVSAPVEIEPVRPEEMPLFPEVPEESGE